MKKTFRTYLISYLVILFLPILILSVVIFSLIDQYTGQQVTVRSHMLQEQLRTQLDLYTAEMDAYALQTTRRSNYTIRHMKESGNFYAIQQDLHEWMATNPMIRNIFLYSSVDEHIYASSAVYDLDGFSSRFFPVTEEMISRVDAFWLKSQSGELYYAAVARIGSTRKHILFFEINEPVLRSLAGAAGLADECSTYLCLRDGTILYKYQPFVTYPETLITGLLRKQSAGGTETTDSGRVLYAQHLRDGDNLAIISLTPHTAAFRTIYRLQTMFIVSLLAIVILGAFLIKWIMNINYQPLKQLETMAADMSGGKTTGDALHTVQQALENLHRDARKSTALRKEQVILKLLLGSYASEDEYHKEAEAAGLTWMGGVSHVVLVRHEVGKLDEDTEEETAASLLPLFEYRPLYLSIPESGIMVFIAPGTVLDLELFRSEIGHMKTAPAVEVSELCESIRDIASVYLKMLTGSPVVDSRLNEMHSAVINAISFGEAERLQLAMNALIADMTEDMSVGRLICCDVLHRILRMLENTGLTLAAEKIRMTLLPMIFTAPDRQTICAVLTEAKELIRQEETGKADVAEDELTERILQYLSDAYSDGSLSVAAVADHFGISVSNLSHYFKNHTGLSVSEAIEKLRIEAACRLLLQDRQSVSLISAKVGYTQPATFMRAFKKRLGVTPTEYRVQNGVN